MENETQDQLTQSIEDGTYYAAARGWYSELFHSPIGQRSFYVIILVLAVLNLYFAFFAFTGIFPLSPRVPFPLYSQDVFNNIANIKRLASSSTEDRNAVVMKYMLSSYVANRESYDLKQYELRYRNIWSESTPAVFKEYSYSVSASNPLSYYRQYADLAKRTVQIQSIAYDQGPQPSHARIVFDALVVSTVNGKEVRHTKWEADITYQYKGFKVSQALRTKNAMASFFGLTGKALKGSGEEQDVTPMSFIVSDYQLKELLE
ncbi:MAG TPA: VirB8/TrbF family protein [Rickettsiales bacterium]|nr:VirB8/TrbF family protein [Rickettsiales bacterium]